MLYLGSDGVTALAEVQALFQTGATGIHQMIHDPMVVFSVVGIVADVVDLRDEDVQNDLGTTEQELAGPWVRAQARHVKGKGPLPVTQVLGQAAYDTALIAGLVYASARADGGTNLVVFPDRLSLNSANRIEVHSSKNLLSQRLP